MSSGGANVGSFEAVRHFRAVLVTFAKEAREALSSFDTEVARTLDWLTVEMPERWKAEIRRADEAVQKAKLELERCRATPLPGGGTPSCMQEKKDLERAKQRKAYAEQKAEATRHWAYKAQREAAEYSGRANQLASQFDADLPQAVVLLDRILTSLEAYRSLRGQVEQPAGTPGAGAGQGSVTNPANVEEQAAETPTAEAGAGETPAGAVHDPAQAAAAAGGETN